MKNVLKYSIIAGLFAVPFIAFIVPTAMYFPFITGKGFTFRILVEILFGLFVLLAFWDKEYRPKLDLISKSILLFIGVIFLADLFSANSYKSFWSNYERMEGFVLMAHLALYYFVLSSVFKTKSLWNKFFNTTIIASLAMSIYGVLQLMGKFTINQGGVRLDGTFGNATYFAIYLVFHIFLCLYMLSDGTRLVIEKWLYGLTALLEVFVLYFTATRGAILGLLGGLVLTGLLIAWKEKENRFWRKVSYWVIGTVVVLSFGFLLVRNTNFVKNSPVLSRFSTLGFSEFKTQGRYFVWPMALEGIKERPILGWGQESFNFVFNKNYNPQMFGQEEWFDRVHDIFLDWLIAGGILGFLAYASMYVALLYYIWKKETNLKVSERSILTGMIAAYIFHNIFVFDNLISYIMFFIILAFVHFVHTENKKVDGALYTKTFSNTTLGYLVLPLVIIFTACAVYFVNVPAILANGDLIQAMTPQKEGVQKNLSYFKEAYDQNSLGSSEVVEQLIQIATQVKTAQGPSDKDKEDFYQYAKAKIEEKVASTPHDARYLVFAGSFFNRFGQYDDAIKYLNRAIAESPKKETIYFELGTSYLGKGDLAKTLDLFKQAYDLKPESKESTSLYAIAAIYARNTVALKELASKVDPVTIVNDSRFLKAYMDIGNYPAAISILNERLKSDPSNVQNLVTLATAYAGMGQKQKAVDIVNQIVKLHPELKTQADAFLKQLQ